MLNLLIQGGVCCLLWLTLYLLVTKLAPGKEVSRFDPVDILELQVGATDKEVRKAYRKLSLLYHPDKNPDDPLAQSKFIRITKAYR